MPFIHCYSYLYAKAYLFGELVKEAGLRLLECGADAGIQTQTPKPFDLIIDRCNSRSGAVAMDAVG